MEKYDGALAAPSVAPAFAIPVVFFRGMVTASFGRQIAYELATVAT